MKELRQWMVAGLALALSVSPLVGCGDNTKSGDGDDNNGSGGPSFCAADVQTLSVALAAAEPAEGFAPLDINLSGQVSRLENVNFSWTYDFGDGTSSQGINQPNITHRFSEPGQYTITLTVKDDTCGKDYTAETAVTVRAPVDLTGSDLTVRPGNVQVTDQIQITMDLQNLTDEPLNLPVTVSYFLSNRAGVLFDELPALVALSTVEVPVDAESGLSVDGNGTVDVPPVDAEIPDNISTGSYFVIAAIDPFKEIGESNPESNNIVASASSVFIENTIDDSPDLIVENVQAGPSTAFQQLSAININADISNAGQRPAESVYAVYVQNDDGEFDRDNAVEVFRSQNIQVDSAEPNNTFNIRAQQIVLPNPIELPEGVDELSVCVWVEIDPDGALDEEDETNNLSRSESCVALSNTPQDGVDIALIDFDIQPRNTFLDGSIEVSLEVANFGTMPTRSFFCSIYLSTDDELDFNQDALLTNVNFSNLPEGQVDTDSRINNVPGFLPVGTFTAFAVCDPSSVVNETFEDNNIRRLDGPIVITPEAIIDLVASDINVTPNEVEDGGSTTLTATVSNEGMSGAGPALARLRRSEDTSCTNADPIIAEGNIAPLGPGESGEITLTAEGVLCDIFQPSYNLCLQLDPGNDVPEIDENNNLVVLNDALTFTGARCNCEVDNFEPNETPLTAVPVVGGDYLDNTICAGGGQDYYGVDLSIGQSLAVRVNLAHTGECSNLDLELLDPNFQVIPDSVSVSDGQLEQADLFLVQAAGRYLIRVKGRTGCDVNRYNMEVIVNSPGPGVDLTGTDLSVNDENPALAQTVEATFTTLNIADDTAQAYDVTLYLSQDTEIDETDFELITSRNEDGLQGARSIIGEVLEFNIPVEAVDENYFVCLMLDSGEEIDENDEDNNIICSEQITVDTSCYDPFEANDLPEDATVIQSGTLENLNVCDGGRDDYYRIQVPDGSRVTVRADFTHRAGDIDLSLLSPGDPPAELERSATVRDFEEVGVEYVNGEQDFLIRVFLNDRNAESNDYTLTVTIEPGDPEDRCEASFEPNNTPDQAIASGSELGLALNQEAALDRCPQDDFDFYYVDLFAGPTVTICAQNDESNPQDFNINLALFDQNQRQLAAQTGTEPCLTRQIVIDGRYFVRVLSVNQDRRAVRYRLTLDGVFGVDLAPSNLNVEPTDIVPGDFDSLVVYSFDLDNGRADRAEGVTYGIYYSTDEVIDPNEDALVETRVAGDIDGFSNLAIEDVVLLPADGINYQPGEGFFGIYVDEANAIDEQDEGNNAVAAGVNLLVCEEDAFDGNQSAAAAPFIDVNTLQDDLTICPGTEDWFCFDDLAPGDYLATANFALNPDDRTGSDLNIAVVAVDENRVTTAELGSDVSLGDNAEVSFNVSAQSDVCIRVFPLRPQGENNYSFQVSTP